MTHDYSDLTHNLRVMDVIKRRVYRQGFAWGCATATGVYLLVALWVRAGAM